MVEQILIDEGRTVLSALKNGGIELSFAVWYSDPSTQSIYLALGAHEFDKIGPSKAYEDILSILNPLRGKFIYFKTDFIKLVSLESVVGKMFLSNFTDKSGDTTIGMFATPNIVFYQVYAYGLGVEKSFE